MSSPVIITEIKASSLTPLRPSVTDFHFGMDFGTGDSSLIQFVRTPDGFRINPDVLKCGAVMPAANVPEITISKLDAGQSDTEAVAGVSDATKRAMDAYAVACSRWFSAMRACIRRERVRQGMFREEHGLPNSAKIPYERQPLTATEEAIASMSEATIRSLFGDTVADYAREKFDHAIQTGDMRAFKIRLLVIKARDCLSKEKSFMHGEFVRLMEQCIDKAEKLAGCIPDPSPRRMSKAEQERKRKREEDEQKQRDMQPELPLVWPNQSSDAQAIQDIDRSATVASTDAASSSKPQNEPINGREPKRGKQSKISHTSKDTQDIDNVTVTVTVTDGGKRGKGKRVKRAKSGVVRKAREYSTVEQILDDIEDGKIVPYESSEEICADLKAGLLTPVEALMFTSALDRYSPQDADLDDPQRMDLERETVGVDDEMDEDDEDGDEDRADGGSSFSYNPNGFAGSDRFGNLEDWD